MSNQRSYIDSELYRVVTFFFTRLPCFVFLLMLTGLESLDSEVLEAARIDVTSFWQELRHVLLPMMLPTIIITMLFRIILSFKVFDEIYLLTGGGPGTATEVVNFSIYQVFIKQDRVGDGAAMSVVTVAAIIVMLLIAMGLIRFMNGRRAAPSNGPASDGKASISLRGQERTGAA